MRSWIIRAYNLPFDGFGCYQNNIFDNKSFRILSYLGKEYKKSFAFYQLYLVFFISFNSWLGGYITENEFFLLRSVTGIFNMIHLLFVSLMLFNLTSVLYSVKAHLNNVWLRNVPCSVCRGTHPAFVMTENEIGFNKKNNISSLFV